MAGSFLRRVRTASARTTSTVVFRKVDDDHWYPPTLLAGVVRAAVQQGEGKCAVSPSGYVLGCGHLKRHGPNGTDVIELRAPYEWPPCGSRIRSTTLAPGSRTPVTVLNGCGNGARCDARQTRRASGAGMLLRPSFFNITALLSRDGLDESLLVSLRFCLCTRADVTCGGSGWTIFYW